MKKQPRDYQRDAANALVKGMKSGVPYANLATGSGKSLVLAMITNWALTKGARVLQLVPAKELCEQNYREAIGYCDQASDVGIVCAMLNRNELKSHCVIATTTSFLNKRAVAGAFDVLLVDECHLCSSKGNSSYQKVIRTLRRMNPAIKIAGVSATPYRAGQGYLHNDCVDGKATFTECVYESDIPKLISEGYLSHVESISGDVEIDTSDLKISGMDYNIEIMGVKFDAIVEDAVKDMKVKFAAYDINTALIFASTVANAKRIIDCWNDDNVIRLVDGKMNKAQRAETINWIKDGSHQRYIVNVGVLTTGFDYPALDCVVLMRATTSLGLYVQMAGRVIRAHEDKELGYIIDYGSNIERHGPIDATLPPKPKKRKEDAPKKFCGLCGEANILSAKKCKNCEAEFLTESEAGKYSMRSKADILKAKRDERYYEVTDLLFEYANSKANGTPMVKMRFVSGFTDAHVEYLFLDHHGPVKNKSLAIFKLLFKDVRNFYLLGLENHNVENALLLLQDHFDKYFRMPKSIVTVKDEGSRYRRLVTVNYD